MSNRRSDEPRIMAVDLRDLRELAQIVERIVSSPPVPAGTTHDRIARARQNIRDRRRRAQLFGPAMFGEAAWDALLHLYVAQEEARLTISRLAELTGAAQSTLLRWLQYLENRQLIERYQHPTDARAVIVQLNQKGIDLMDSYFSETLTPVR